jgi:GNAT superfamily N-acetyltransferase
MNKFSFIKVNSHYKNYELIRDFHNMCKNIFNEHELEKCSDWERSIENKNNIISYFIIITHKNKVIGGIINEIYTNSMCCLISYLAIDKDFRGCGLSKKLISKAIEELVRLTNNNINAIFIEVRIPENNEDKQRQIIWNKLNFIPLDFTFQHPGVLKWKQYQLAIYDTNCKEIKKSLLFSFFEDFFEGILKKYDKDEINKIKKQLNMNNDKCIQIGTKLWK